ncbi:MAG: hypothetical protein R6W74_08255 [Nitrosomonas halophila]
MQSGFLLGEWMERQSSLKAGGNMKILDYAICLSTILSDVSLA